MKIYVSGLSFVYTIFSGCVKSSDDRVSRKKTFVNDINREQIQTQLFPFGDVPRFISKDLYTLNMTPDDCLGVLPNRDTWRFQ